MNSRDEEQILILQMLADGKLTPAEADQLLRALKAGDWEAAQPRGEPPADLGQVVERTVNESLRGLDELLRRMESQLKSQLERQIERQMERQMERQLERRLREGVAQAVRHGARAGRREPDAAPRRSMLKVGIAVDKVCVDHTETLTLPVHSGDRLVLANRTGDVRVSAADGDHLVLTVRKRVWGQDEADAATRADATRVRLERSGTDVRVVVDQPSIVGVGVLMVKEPDLDYDLKVPGGMQLDVTTQVGDIHAGGLAPSGLWRLESGAGDVEVQVPPGAGFAYDLQAAAGTVRVELGEAGSVIETKDGRPLTGRLGQGSARLEARVRIGDIRIYHG